MRLQKAAFVFLILAVLLTGLSVGKNLLIPLVLAVFIWYLMNALAALIHSLPIGKYRVPKALCLPFSVVFVFAGLTLLVNLITANIAQVITLAPEYQIRIDALLAKGWAYFDIEEPPTFSQLTRELNFESIFQRLAGAMTSLAGRAGIITVYVLFLFLEQKTFGLKIKALFPNKQRRSEFESIIGQIGKDIRTYVGIKTFTSALTGFLSYVILQSLGLDFAVFWGLLIFIFNFIPTIGSIIATAFPALLALVQFEDHPFGYFLAIALGVGALQFFIGNVLEPRLMGRTLNLSPLVILLSLALWNMIWGIPGMFFCVPLTVIAVIICSNFPATRAVAVMLTSDGQIKQLGKPGGGGGGKPGGGKDQSGRDGGNRRRRRGRRGGRDQNRAGDGKGAGARGRSPDDRSGKGEDGPAHPDDPRMGGTLPGWIH